MFSYSAHLSIDVHCSWEQKKKKFIQPVNKIIKSLSHLSQSLSQANFSHATDCLTLLIASRLISRRRSPHLISSHLTPPIACSSSCQSEAHRSRRSETHGACQPIPSADAARRRCACLWLVILFGLSWGKRLEIGFFFFSCCGLVVVVAVVVTMVDGRSGCGWCCGSFFL